MARVKFFGFILVFLLFYPDYLEKLVPANIIYTEVDGQKLQLSNLEKVLYPTIGVTKAQVIQYYLSQSDLLLKYIGNRGLTLIRYPDGVEGKSFYSKDKPKWTPKWIKSVAIQHDQKVIEYIIADNKATIVWLANLACLEIHPMQSKMDRQEYPDYFVFDLDPDAGVDFQSVKETATILKKHLAQYDYPAYVKTSGGKGLHIIVPIQAKCTYEVMIESVKSLTKALIAKYPNLYTLELSKEKRKGKILIDIYRNYATNTTVGPYSLRGREGAPISMPFDWEDLPYIESAKYFTILNYNNYLIEKGDAWAQWRSEEAKLHDQRILVAVDTEDTDSRLNDYVEKRDLPATPEPDPIVSTDHTNKYVIQLHNASNLHYDLRLEHNGVLLSWAIPKGLPFRKGQKRLAIRTEDHPIKYLFFEGVIPSGQYGAGEMWIFNAGSINWISKSDSSYKFSLSDYGGKAIFSLYRTKPNDHWLVEIEKDIVPFDADQKPVKPMLAESTRNVPQQSRYQYEVKWDGIRVVIYIISNKVRIISRNGNELTDQFPEFQQQDVFEVEQAIIDAEIVVLDEEGRPQFHEVISRMHTAGSQSIQSLSKSKPACCYVFDMMCIDGISIINIPLKKRRNWLKIVLNESQSSYRFSESFSDGQALFQAIESKGMEGIMAKDQESIYEPGSRSRAWLKIKCRKMDQCLIIGYTEGNGDRSSLFGALHLAKENKGALSYMGKVGTGFDQKAMKEIQLLLSEIKTIKKPNGFNVEEQSRSIWIEPKLSCKIEYATMSANNTYREPVFINLIHH